MNKLQFLLMLKTGKTPKKLYEQRVSQAYVKHNTKANEKAFDAVVKMFKRGFGDWQYEFQKAYEETAISPEVKKTLKDYTSMYYKYRKQKNAIRFKKFAKAEFTYQLNMTDKETIKILGQSDLLWIKSHAVRTLASSYIQDIIQEGLVQNLSGDAIAELLTSSIKGLESNKYIEMFGEQRYWEMVTNTNMTRLTAFNDINDMEYLEYEEYYIDTRGALACEICAPYQNKRYSVGDAAVKRDAYLEYAKNEDTEGMKNVFTFGRSNVDGFGEVPPFHPNCYCELLPYLE